VMDYRAFTNSVILCHFEDVTAQGMVDLLNAVTGWDWTVEDVARAGERIYTFKRWLNHRLGMTRADDHYYRIRGWDEETGEPREATLKRLGII